MWESDRPFGLAVCSPCSQALSANTVNRRSWYMRNNRVHVHVWTVLGNQQIDQATGETTGSLVLFKDVKQIETTYQEQGKCIEVLEEQLLKLDNGINQEDKDRAKVFVAAFDEAMSGYDTRVKAKRDVVIAKRRAKEAQRASRKLEMARPVLKKIESALKSYKYRDIALECGWCESTGRCTFRNWPSMMALGPLLSAPSSATLKKIATGVSHARGLYNLLESEGFIGDNFPLTLRQKLCNQDLPEHDRGLIKYFVANKNSETMLKIPSRWNRERREKFSDRLSRGMTALAIFMTASSEEVRASFVYGVVEGPFISKKEKLAAKAWNRKVRVNGLYVYRNLGEYYQEAKEEYLSLLEHIRQYKNNPETVAWLAETSEPDIVGQTFTREVSLLFLHLISLLVVSMHVVL